MHVRARQRYLIGCGPVIGFVDSRIRGLKTTPKNEHFRITSKTKSGRPISPPWQATSAVSRLSRQKIAPNQKTRSDRDWRSSITPTHATMAAIVAPVAILAPRVTAPKARAARTLRASTFNGVKVAQPKVRAGRRTLCRGKTPLHGACDIFHLLVSHRRARRGPRSRPRDEIKPVARGWHARYPFVAFPFGRSCFAPRGTHDRPGSGPVAFRRRRSFPRRLSRGVRGNTDELLFCFLPNANGRVCKVAKTTDALLATRRDDD